MQKISILGSTGSVGVNALDVVAKSNGLFEIVGLTARKNDVMLEAQIRAFGPRAVALTDAVAADRLRKRLGNFPVEVLSGVEGAVQVAGLPEADVVLASIVGAAGLVPTLAAVRAGKKIGLANKETMVMAGEWVCAEARKSGSTILPVDSEHSAVFQCLEGHRRRDVRRIVLTASGGPFRDLPASEFSKATREQALRHPNWKMGEKITIDSATLMNKGLEVVEARWLFDLPAEKIDIVVHRQSVVHSMVEYVDGSVIAQLGVADMRGPIAYALSYPERISLDLAPLDLTEIGSLTFERPDRERFPCIGYAYDALSAGGTMPAVLNAANEEAVWAFLKGRIVFTDIARIIRSVMEAHRVTSIRDLDTALEADRSGREAARNMILAVAQT